MEELILNTIVINLFGEPGTKSTAAMDTRQD